MASLKDVFGETPKTRILEVLLTEDHHDLSSSDIARNAGIHRTTVYDHLPDLVELGIVTQTRTSGGNPMYQIDKDSEVAEKIGELDHLVVYGENTEE